MAHRVDIDSIHQNIFVLLNICYAAKAFGQNHDLSSYEEAEPINGPYYVGWLKFTLSEKLIDVAIKTRVILDIVKAEEARYRETGETYDIDSRALDKAITDQYNIGFFVGTDEEVSMREACNKIIHALDIRPILERGNDEHALDEESERKRDWLYWEGTLDLSGKRGKDDWHFTLHVSDFGQALEQFIKQIEYTIDWKSIHYDLDVF